MSPLGKIKSTHATILFAALVLVAFVTMVPGAFAESNYNANNMPNGVVYTPADNPYGPLQMYGWGAAMAIAAGMAGVGAWSAIRKH